MKMSEERKAQIVASLTEELSQAIIKVNHHLHSGYQHNDERQPSSIFMNFFKKQQSVLHSSLLLRMKNRDMRLSLDQEKYVCGLSFTDNAYEYFTGMIESIQLLNEACKNLDFATLKSKTNTQDKFFKITDKIIDNIKNFKFGGS